MDVKRQRFVAIASVFGGVIVVGQLRWRIRGIQKEQRLLMEVIPVSQDRSKPTVSISKTKKVAVDGLFAKRLSEILRICVPSVFSKECFFVLLQSSLLISRTLLSDRIAELEGVAGQSVVSKDWEKFVDMLWNFAATAVPAAFVNSGLKYMQSIISLAFRQRLTEHLHHRYLSNRVYYVASTLGGLSNADQRIAEDVERFCSSISELFSYTFKPVLDIVLFTRSLARSIGYKGQLALYGYFILCSLFLRSLSPPLALLTAQESSLSGNFRNAHQRLVAHAEEIAFNDPPGGDTERLILNDHLFRLLRHSKLSAFQRFVQQVADGYLVKYSASIIGLLVYAIPIYFSKQKSSTEVLTGDYIRSMRLMMNTSSAIGQLVLIYKRVTSLAGVTSRVSELLESIKQLSTKEGQKSANLMKPPMMSEHEKLVEKDVTPPSFAFGNMIKFEKVTIQSPDGTILVHNLSFEVHHSQSVIIMGPNGSGKSSLFRVLAELWLLQSGKITRPHRGEIFYLSQRPYVVRGSLRDQIRYPQPPLAIAASTTNRRYFASLNSKHSNSNSNSMDEKMNEEDERVMQALKDTEIDYLARRGNGLDQVQNWEETLSGGERQRLAVARVLFHHPKFAVLDECTSAVSADGEEKLYKRLHESNITMLSIAHRPALKKYHQFVLEFDGTRKDHGWSFKPLSAENS